MSHKECDTCGEELPVKMFWGPHRRPQSTCTPCRRKEARQKRYQREKIKSMERQKRQEVREALRQQDERMRDTQIYAGVLELNKIISRIDSKLRRYAEKVEFSEATPRTESAIEYQWRRKEYFEEIKELLYTDAQHGVDRPLEYYLSNTFLLHKHGFPVVVKDADPREEHTDVNS